VRINDENKGTTPLKLTGMDPGSYNVDVFFDQDRVWDRDIEIKPAHTASVKAREKDADKVIWILSRPHNANVFVNGEYVGRTSTEIVKTDKWRWHKKVMKNPKELKVTGVKPGKYLIELISFPDFDYGPEQKVAFEYIVNDDDICAVDIFRNKITTIDKEFSGKQRKTSFELMKNDEDSMQKKDDLENNMWKSAMDELDG
jgi:hypothetical protein